MDNELGNELIVGKIDEKSKLSSEHNQKLKLESSSDYEITQEGNQEGIKFL